MYDYESPITLFMDEIHAQQIQHTEDCIFQAVQRVGVDVNKDELLKALKYDRDQYNEGYQVGYSSGMEVFAEALDSICWYNSHGPFLMNLAERIESETDETFLYPEDIKWDTEEHFFWMILVSIFGDYGTSIRCGWIEKKEDCVAFIKRICRLYLSEEEDEV